MRKIELAKISEMHFGGRVVSSGCSNQTFLSCWETTQVHRLAIDRYASLPKFLASVFGKVYSFITTFACALIASVFGVLRASTRAQIFVAIIKSIAIYMIYMNSRVSNAKDKPMHGDNFSSFGAAKVSFGVKRMIVRVPYRVPRTFAQRGEAVRTNLGVLVEGKWYQSVIYNWGRHMRKVLRVGQLTGARNTWRPQYTPVGVLAAMVMMLTGACAAQTGAITSFCNAGAAKAQVSGIPSTNTLQAIVPLCRVTVYNTGTVQYAPIYADKNGTALSNPFTSSSLGQYTFWASTAGCYDIVLSGGTPPNAYPSPVTITDVCASGGGGSGGVTSIIAGTNVTVSPIGGTGDVTINATPPTGGITALTGDVTASGTGTVTTTLATVNATPGTYVLGSTVITVNGKGLLTFAGTPFAAAFGCTQCGNYETGFSVSSASGTISYANPSVPTSASVSDGTNVVTLTTPFTSWSLAHAYIANTTFTLTAVGNAQTVTQQAGIAFYPRTFGGVGTAGATGATASGSNAALAGATGTLSSAGLGNQGSYGPYNASGQKIYVLTTGAGHTFSSGGFSFPMNSPTAVSFVNQYGATVPMYLYESTNVLSSTFTLTVTN